MWFQQDDWVNNYIWPNSSLSVTLPSQELLWIFKFPLFHFLWLLGKQSNSLGHPRSTVIRAPSSSWHLSCHMPTLPPPPQKNPWPGQLCALCSGDTDSTSLNISCDFSFPCLCTCYWFWKALKTPLYTHSDIMWLVRLQHRVLKLILSALRTWLCRLHFGVLSLSGTWVPKAGSIHSRDQYYLGLQTSMFSGPVTIPTELATLSTGPRSGCLKSPPGNVHAPEVWEALIQVFVHVGWMNG